MNIHEMIEKAVENFGDEVYEVLNTEVSYWISGKNPDGDFLLNLNAKWELVKSLTFSELLSDEPDSNGYLSLQCPWCCACYVDVLTDLKNGEACLSGYSGPPTIEEIEGFKMAVFNDLLFKRFGKSL